MAIKEPFRPLSAVLLHISLRCISAFHTVCLLCHSLFNGDPLLPAIQSFTFLGLKVITTLICCPLLCMPECIRSWLKCPPAAPRAHARARAYTRWWSGGQWGACIRINEGWIHNEGAIMMQHLKHDGWVVVVFSPPQFYHVCSCFSINEKSLDFEFLPWNRRKCSFDNLEFCFCPYKCYNGLGEMRNI